MKSRVLYALIGLSLGFFAYPLMEAKAQDASFLKSREYKFKLYYRCDEIDIDSTYLDNTMQMDTIVRYLALSPRIDSITVYSYASPEGGFRRNKWLAERRAEAAREFILSHLAPGAPEPEIILRPTPEHWDGLYEEVDSNYHRHDREKVLRIIKDDRVGDETKKWRLKQLDNGYTWSFLIRRHMPELRMATWICIWVPPLEPVEPVKADAVAQVPRLKNPPPPEKKVYAPALKTNLLYDVVTALNASAEFPIGDRFSVMVEDVFPWWAWGPNDRQYCFQLWEIGLEPRYWFKPKGNLLGHYVGIYGKSAKYDFQNDLKLCYQGEYWSAGISYGYAMPVGKLFHLEFSLSVGYLSTDYRHYQPDPAYEHLYRDPYKVGKVSYFGPTKLAVSLVLPIEFELKR